MLWRPRNRRRALPFRPQPAFSLLELLISFSIILSLAALLVPALKAVRESAQQATCMNNMRQIGLAINMYGQEKGRYPLAYESDRNFTHRIEVYLSGKTGFNNSSNDLRSTMIQCPARKYAPSNVVNCYGMHARVVGDLIFDGFFDPPDPGIYPRVYPFTQRTTEVILLADADQRPSSSGGEAFPSLWSPLDWSFFDYSASTAEADPSWGVGDNQDSNSFFSYGQMRFRHKFNRRANVMMIDGHIESLDMDDVKRKHVRINDG